jgi:hypothetical protein
MCFVKLFVYVLVQLLLGDSCGKTLIPTEINDNQFKALQEVISQQRITGGEKLLTLYAKNDDVKPGFYLLQVRYHYSLIQRLKAQLNK